MLFAKLNILMFFVALFCFATITHADYIEGIDTTDVNGYGLDSTFQIIAGKVIQATSEATQFIPYFRVDGDGCFLPALFLPFFFLF